MEIQKINWKVYIDDLGGLTPDDFFRVFNSWIPDSPEIFIDVADYQHVPEGPLVVLIGHHVSYALDQTDGSYGLLYSRNRDTDGSNEEKITNSLSEVMKACKRLEDESSFEGRLKFNPTKLLFVVNDRALAPNSEQTFAAIKADLERSIKSLFPASSPLLEHLDDPRKRFRVKVTLNS
jgi:hypothetical protein